MIEAFPCILRGEDVETQGRGSFQNGTGLLARTILKGLCQALRGNPLPSLQVRDRPGHLEGPCVSAFSNCLRSHAKPPTVPLTHAYSSVPMHIGVAFVARRQ